MTRPLVFGIGFGRTGVTSLRSALLTLGWRPYQQAGSPLIVKFNEGHFPLPRGYDAFVDDPFPAFYRDLRIHYPGAKFILTVRDKEDWLASIKWRHEETEKNGFLTPLLRASRAANYGSPRFNRDIYSASFEAHYSGVLSYFQKELNSQLLVYDVKDGWPRLCKFLGMRVPDDMGFPHLNGRPS